MNFRRSPTSIEILTIIATATDVPRAVTKHMLGSQRTINDNFRFLVNERHIGKTKPKNGVASYRLTQKGKGVLCDPHIMGEQAEVFKDYFENRAPQLCGTKKQLTRLHRQAEVIVACHNAGIKSYIGEKAFLQKLGETAQNAPFNDGSVFYTSQELKRAFPVQDKFASASRVIGVIATPEQPIFVYNTNHAPIKFSSDQERKAYEIFCKAIIQSGYVPNAVRQRGLEANAATTAAIKFCNENKDAIVFGADWDAAARMLEISGSYNAKTLIQPQSTAYNAMRYIPNTRDGELTLQMITQSNWRTRILSAIVRPEKVTERPQTLGCDLYTTDRQAIYCLLDMDLTRLLNIKQILELHGLGRSAYIVCFKYQSALLKEWFKGLVSNYVEITPEQAQKIIKQGL